MTTRPVPMVVTRPGRITKDLLQFMRNVQAWYQGRGCHLTPSPGDHTVEASLTRLANQCLCLGSFQVPHIAETHPFCASSDRGTLNLVATIAGEYLALLVRNLHGQIVAAGITHLVRDGKSFIRVTEAGEYVCALIDLQAMNSHIVTVDSLIEALKNTSPYQFDKKSGDVICFTDLRDDLTLQVYATVRRLAMMQGQPVTVNNLLEATHRQLTCGTPNVSLTRPSSFEADVCEFLLTEYYFQTGGEGLIRLVDLTQRLSATAQEKIGKRKHLYIVGSAPAVAQRMNRALEHSLTEIARRTEWTPG